MGNVNFVSDHADLFLTKLVTESRHTVRRRETPLRSDSDVKHVELDLHRTRKDKGGPAEPLNKREKRPDAAGTVKPQVSQEVKFK
jgi:hypothetical protein